MAKVIITFNESDLKYFNANLTKENAVKSIEGFIRFCRVLNEEQAEVSGKQAFDNLVIKTEMPLDISEVIMFLIENPKMEYTVKINE